MRVSITYVLLAFGLAVSAATVEKRQATQSIDKLFKAYGKLFFGTAADQNRLSVSQFAFITAAYFGGVTPENSMTWISIEPSRGSFNWRGPDFLVNWAQTNGKTVRGHTFVWAQQTPAWVTSINDAATLTTVLQNHITQVMTRYKGKLYAIDVVNEHINEDGSIKSTHWTQVLGNNVFTIAFEAARAADPSVKLYISDYNLDSNNAKVQGIVRLVKSLNANGQIVDGIGSQGHLAAGQGASAQAALTALASAGVEVAITELDIANAPTADYQNVVEACLAVPACVSITVSGVRDTDSWRASTTPLLFNGNWQPKAAYSGIVSVLSAGITTTVGPTTTPGTTTTPPQTTSTPPPSSGTAQHWDQFGGEAKTDREQLVNPFLSLLFMSTDRVSTACVSPFTCQALNPFVRRPLTLLLLPAANMVSTVQPMSVKDQGDITDKFYVHAVVYLIKSIASPESDSQNP
ncbi:glycoside hydrolase superfamily [Mycena rebaudengoi]|nr:glycoside hydrolase superfamily [Mycena rebaudengoi]